MYQALQNSVWGTGAIAGASLGGLIADTIGWRWCFLLQVPISVLGFAVGWFVLADQQHLDESDEGRLKGMWEKVDISGALILVTSLSMQLVGLSLGGNELPWGSGWVIGSLVGSVVLLGLFVWVEARTRAMPIIPLRMLSGRLSVSVQVTNICAGLAAYAVSSLRLRKFCLLTVSSTSSCSLSSSKSFSSTQQQQPEHASPSPHSQRPLVVSSRVSSCPVMANLSPYYAQG